MFEERKPYRTLTIHTTEDANHRDFKLSVYKETHEGDMMSFDGEPFMPSTFPFEVVLDWLERGGGKVHGYTWEVS